MEVQIISKSEGVFSAEYWYFCEAFCSYKLPDGPILQNFSGNFMYIKPKSSGQMQFSFAKRWAPLV